MQSLVFAFHYPLVLIGHLLNNNQNSFICLPTKDTIQFKIHKSNQHFTIKNLKKSTIINFDQTQKLPQPYSSFKKALKIIFTQIYQVEIYPSLAISTNQKLTKYNFGALLIATIKSLSKYYSLNLTDHQIFGIITTIFNNHSYPPDNYFVQTLTALFNQPFYFNHLTQAYQFLDLESFFFQFYDLNQKLTKTIIKDYSQDPKYHEDIVHHSKRISFLASQAQKAIFQKANIQLGENLTKNQKVLNELGFKHNPSHELLVESNLTGAFGAKVVEYKTNLHFLILRKTILQLNNQRLKPSSLFL